MFTEKLVRRIHILRWALPLATAGLVILYQVVLASWISAHFGPQYHLISEILFYGTLGPLLAFAALDLLSRWVEERETSDVQAQVLAQAQKKVEASRGLTDTALQTVYAASVMLASLKHTLPDLPLETSTALHQTEQDLDGAIQQLRSHLQNQTTPAGNGARTPRSQPVPEKPPKRQHSLP